MTSGFFSYLPPEPPVEPERSTWRPPPWMQPPGDELPVVLPAAHLLGRSDQAVVTISVVEVFSVGVRIPVETVVRRRDETRFEWQQKMQTHHFPPHANGLRLGVELADGTRLGTHPEFIPPHEQEPTGPVLTNHGGGGGGGDDRWELTFRLWLWPLPPAGTLDVVAEWVALDLLETRVTLDATAIRAAASAVQPLWAD